jgi:hypothetical protein
MPNTKAAVTRMKTAMVPLIEANQNSNSPYDCRHQLTAGQNGHQAYADNHSGN